MTLTKGQKVSFTFYGKPETATIERIANGIVWLDNGRWMHEQSVTPIAEDRSESSATRSVVSVQARKAVADALELAKARRILLTADWAVTPAEKQLARKVIDRLTHNAAKKGFKGQ